MVMPPITDPREAALRRRKAIALALLGLAGIGLAVVSVLERTHQRIGPSAPDPTAPLPLDCHLDDGLAPDEAVGVAFWRSPALQAELTRLDAAMADLDEASRWPNPRLSFLAPIDPRQLALILAWPIDAIWQRPERAEAATRELERDLVLVLCRGFGGTNVAVVMRAVR